MKKYSPEERAAAIKKLPRPASYFVGSKRLYEIYKGIGNKLNLTQKQFMQMAEIAGVTLIGLEPESALEANIHYLMPELPNATAKELVLDIQDRILKESQRRIKEEVFEQDSFVPSEMGLTPEQELERQRQFTIDAMDDDDPELVKLIEEEKAERAKREAEEAGELEKAVVESQKPRPRALANSEASLASAEAAASTSDDAPISIPTTAPAIAAQKLAAPTAQQAGETQIDSVLARPSVGSIALPATPESTPTKRTAPTPPLTKTDPYREPVN